MQQRAFVNYFSRVQPEGSNRGIRIQAESYEDRGGREGTSLRVCLDDREQQCSTWSVPDYPFWSRSLWLCSRDQAIDLTELSFVVGEEPSPRRYRTVARAHLSLQPTVTRTGLGDVILEAVADASVDRSLVWLGSVQPNDQPLIAWTSEDAPASLYVEGNSMRATIPVDALSRCVSECVIGLQAVHVWADGEISEYSETQMTLLLPPEPTK
jgi:hypothetical protein